MFLCDCIFRYTAIILFDLTLLCIRVRNKISIYPHAFHGQIPQEIESQGADEDEEVYIDRTVLKQKNAQPAAAATGTFSSASAQKPKSPKLRSASDHSSDLPSFAEVDNSSKKTMSSVLKEKTREKAAHAQVEEAPIRGMSALSPASLSSHVSSSASPAAYQTSFEQLQSQIKQRAAPQPALPKVLL
jgi:hypothetical protein